MINFTGSSKKRIVNLGNNRRNGFGPGPNFLEQSRLQRIQREEMRHQEKAALVLQSNIRRHLALIDAAKEVQHQWRTNANGANSANWGVQFEYVAKWCVPRQSFTETIIDLGVLAHHLKQQNHITQQATLNRVVACLSSIVTTCNRISGPSVDRQEVMAHVISNLDMVSNLIVPVTTPEFIDGLVTFFTTSSPRQDLVVHIVSSVFRLNSLSRVPNFVRFLTVPGILPGNINTDQVVLENKDLKSLSSHDLVNLVINYIHMRGDAQLSTHDFDNLAAILELINFSVAEYDEEDDESRAEAASDTIEVTSLVIEQLQYLYTSAFVNQLMSYTLKAPNSSKSINAFKIVSALFILYPQSQTKLSMWIIITPGAFNWFYTELQGYTIYHTIKQVANTGQDYLKLDQLKAVAATEDGHESMFWKSVYAFEELYSFWLIVSNDLESFSGDKLSLQDVVGFLEFLRSLCLTLIFIPSATEDDISTITSKLTKITIALLNQLYLKNLRLKFLPVDFWKTNELAFSSDALLQLIVEDEQHKFEEDEDEEPIKLKPKSGRSAEVSSKLQVLRSVPFFIPFKLRVKIFQTLIELDKQNIAPINPFAFNITDRISADIRRENLLEDAFDSFYSIGSGFKKQLSVKFFNEYGGQEAGIDGGGITKEFLTSVAHEGFNPSADLGLFKETTDHQIYPNDEIYLKIAHKISPEEQYKKLSYLRFLGMVIGKCFYENVLIDVSFSPFFLNKWCNEKMKNSINDLNSLDSELFHNLMKLEKMSEEEISQLDLNFTLNETLDGKSYQIDLIGGGAGESTSVTQKNKLNYIHQISNFKLNQSLYIQTKYFTEGLEEIISPDWLKMFDSYELQMLISGGKNDINIEDWKENVEYGGFFDDDLTIHYFWEIIKEMTPEERSKLIKFVTSVSRAPLLGFGSLSPKFGIRNSGKDIKRLPTASTCVNLLKLPDYQDKKLMREKLLYAINEDARFDLS